MEINSKKLDELYKEWSGDYHTTNSNNPTHDSSECIDFAEHCLKKVVSDGKMIPTGDSKSNIPLVMPLFLADLKANWKPKTETKTGYCYHGMSKGDEIKYTMYFDEYRCEWTTKDRAFQGLVFKEINKFLK